MRHHIWLYPMRQIFYLTPIDVFEPLGRLSPGTDDVHRYKAPQANRPGDRPYERKKIK